MPGKASSYMELTVFCIEVHNTCTRCAFSSLHSWSWECVLDVRSGGPGSLLIPTHMYPIFFPFILRVVSHSLSSLGWDKILMF